eukprot:1082385-Pyramimonas_sp.AAC.1
MNVTDREYSINAENVPLTRRRSCSGSYQALPSTRMNEYVSHGYSKVESRVQTLRALVLPCAIGSRSRENLPAPT